jgi:3-oxoacyl-[acyl-carrier protein] reductase
MNLSLENKTALITGGSQGIGLASARELALLGAHCLIASRSENDLKAALASLDVSKAQRHAYYVMDLSDGPAVKALAATITAQHPVDILVNNSGGPAGGPVLDATETDFLNTLQQHLLASHLLAQAFVPGMKARGFGRIIQVISTSVKTPLHNLGVSNTTRAAVASWSKTLSNEVAASGITVNNVLPGATLTGRLSGLFEKQSAAQHKTLTQVEEEWRQTIPAKRFGLPEEVAAMVAFLASPAAGYVNGVSIAVDGGRTPTLS